MKYDSKKVFNQVVKINMQWHGDDTKVLLRGDAVKTPVAKGDVIQVEMAQAKELIAYSSLWTLEGDEPIKHPFDVMMAKLREQADKEAKKGAVKGENKEKGGKAEINLADLKPEEMDKDEIMKALKKLGATFNNTMSQEKLAALLKEVIADQVDVAIADLKPEEETKE